MSEAQAKTPQENDEKGPRTGVRQKQAPQGPPNAGGLDAAPSLADGIPQKKQRTWTFTIPDSARIGEHDPKKVTMRELAPDDLALTHRLGRGNEQETAEWAVKLALWKVDGQHVNHSEEESSWYWGRWSAKIRHLLNLAWAKIHATNKEEDQDFLSSMAPE